MRCPNLPTECLCCCSFQPDPAQEAVHSAEERALEVLHDLGTSEIDIVAIHGLGGHPHSTWTATNDQGENKFWLKDFLPSDLPHARIMTFGYESDFGFTKSTSGVRDFALHLLERMHTLRRGAEKRKIIFVCHSLGGIVCKKAIILANEIPRFSDILESTYGIVFMGTPHLGSGLAWKGNVLLVIPKHLVSVGGFGANVKNKVVKGLKSNSRELWEITTSFTPRTESIKEIVTCIEQHVVPGMAKRIVDDRSATLHIHIERTMIMRAHHMNMCKFASNTEDRYIELRNALQELFRNAVRPPEGGGEGGADQRERYEKCLESLGVSSDDHRTLVPDPDAETCGWILSDPSYKEWESSKCSSCIFLSGDPGAGKSVMSKFLIKNLEEKPEAKRPLIGSFFYPFGGTISVLDSVRQILYQIIQQDWTLLNHSTVEPENFSKGCWDGPTEGPLWRFFGIVLRAITKPLFIIIDGVDLLAEKERRKLLDELTSLVQNKECKSELKVLITGRPLQEVELKVNETPGMQHLQMDREKIKEDIRRFLSNKIKEFERSNLRELESEHKKELEDSIQIGAGSMFLWASLAWLNFTEAKSLGENDKWNPSDWESDAIKRRLKRLGEHPQKVGDMYSSMANAIDQKNKEYAKQILGCLLAASRSLTIRELRALIFHNDPGATPGYIQQQLRKICGEFISIQQDDTVQLMHQTVAEFLMPESGTGQPNPSELHEPKEWYIFERAMVHQELGVSCLLYLTTRWNPNSLLKPDDSTTNESTKEFAQYRAECKTGLRKIFNANPLLEYASLNWAYHLGEAFQASKKETGQLPGPTLGMFINSGLPLSCSFQIYWLCNGRGAFPGDVTPLHILSYFGFSDFIGDVGAASPENVHATDTSGRTPLHWAAERGKYETVQELLKINGEVNPVGERDAPSPLHLAASCGHMEVVEVLLHQGANPNTKNEEFGTPLQAAAYSGNEEVVALLLARGADPNALAGEFGSALQAAATNGKSEAVKTLLAEGAKVTARGGRSGSALQAAALGGHSGVIKLLLSTAARISAQSDVLDSAQEIAAGSGYTEVALYLKQVMDRSGLGLTGTGAVP